MSRKLASIVGTVAAVAICDASTATAQAQPNPAEALRAQSYAELLEPIPNALALLKADDRLRNDQDAGVQLVDYHHHHHHHRYWRGWNDDQPYYYHHHHHHHRYWRWWYSNPDYGYHHHHHHYRDWDDR